jgi:hypothetical protein
MGSMAVYEGPSTPASPIVKAESLRSSLGRPAYAVAAAVLGSRGRRAPNAIRASAEGSRQAMGTIGRVSR